MQLVLAHVTVGVSTLAVAMALGVVIVALLPWRDAVRPAQREPLLLVAYAALAFQVVHALEHVLQIGYWLRHPTQPPWLTPWAEVGREALAAATDGRAATGDELLHLSGNLIFLIGLAAAVAVARRRTDTASWLSWALWLQAAHVVEHALLTATAVTLGQAHGLSTGFGLLTPGTVVAGAVRVWLHLALNLTATALAVGGVVRLGLGTAIGDRAGTSLEASRTTARR